MNARRPPIDHAIRLPRPAAEGVTLRAFLVLAAGAALVVTVLTSLPH
jgi:hypothetical protein